MSLAVRRRLVAAIALAGAVAASDSPALAVVTVPASVVSNASGAGVTPTAAARALADLEQSGVIDRAQSPSELRALVEQLSTGNELMDRISRALRDARKASTPAETAVALDGLKAVRLALKQAQTRQAADDPPVDNGNPVCATPSHPIDVCKIGQRHPFFLGAPWPYYINYASGYFRVNGTQYNTLCGLEDGADDKSETPSPPGNQSRVDFYSSALCNRNIPMQVDTDLRNFSPTGGNGALFAEGDGFCAGGQVDTDSCTASGTYYRNGTNQFVRGYFTLTMPYSGAWSSVPSGCTGVNTSVMSCVIDSLPFQYVFYPPRAPDANAVLQQVLAVINAQIAALQALLAPTVSDASYVADGAIGYVADPGIPSEPSATTPAGDGEAVDDVTAEDPYGDWVALPGGLVTAVRAHQISLQAAEARAVAQGKPPFHCSARLTKKVGDLMITHTEGGIQRQSEIRWTVRNRCAGGDQVVRFKGDHQVIRDVAPRTAISRLFTYDDTAAGLIMNGKWNGKAVEIGNRRAKRVWWDMAIEAPPGYQWFSAESVGDLRGIDERKIDCSLESTGGYPAYTNKLSCFLASDRFT